MKQHPHIEVITAWYNGAVVQTSVNHGVWIDCVPYRADGAGPPFSPTAQYRIKPEPTCKLELTKKEVDALWGFFQTYPRFTSANESLKSISRKLNTVEYTA